MDKIDDLKYIKTHYGEKMMKLCRDLFPAILETPGKLSKIMKNSFYPSKSLYYDIVDNKLENQFEDYINKKIEIKQVELLSTNKTPFELMEDAGYELYECKTEEEIQVFRKYYDKRGQKYDMCRNEIPRHVGEELCTFDGGRLESCHVFFAVKKEAEKLRREEFKKPMREDEYGTSVISIQFSRYNYRLSIKNRYNHTVDNPDATFGNNLENIIPGLTKSFEEYYGCEIKQSDEDDFEIPDYIELDGKFYKYNYEYNNIYYCPDNIIIKNGTLITTYNESPERYIVMDYFILDLKAKTLMLLNETIKDSFIDEYKNIEKIDIKKEASDKIITITTKEGIESKIIINNQNQIIGYENNKIKVLEKFFLFLCKTIKSLELENIRKIEDNCFHRGGLIKKLYMPHLELLGKGCFFLNEDLEELYFPEIKVMKGNNFHINYNLKKICLPKLIEMGDNCFVDTRNLESIDMHLLKKMGEKCFSNADALTEILLKNLKEMGRECFDQCEKLKELNLPQLERMEFGCFHMCERLAELNLPQLENMGRYCFCNSYPLKSLNLPKLEYMGEWCFHRCAMIEVRLPKLKVMESGCFAHTLEEIYTPNLTKNNNINLP